MMSIWSPSVISSSKQLESLDLVHHLFLCGTSCNGNHFSVILHHCKGHSSNLWSINISMNHFITVSAHLHKASCFFTTKIVCSTGTIVRMMKYIQQSKWQEIIVIARFVSSPHGAEIVGAPTYNEDFSSNLAHSSIMRKHGEDCKCTHLLELSCPICSS